jgi:hypothetical protein
MLEPSDGRASIERAGLSYLPRFITAAEATGLIEYFGLLSPLWEQRHPRGQHGRSDSHPGRLTRPVYWLGAWQFASLGYYAEPHHREHRCLRAEALTPIMSDILRRLRPVLAGAHVEENPLASADPPLPNTCLINYYGRDVSGPVPVDYARLRMHRDGEPGPVVMFNLGQAGLLEFLDPERSAEPELGVWTRHRSVTILSGPEFKDRLYHRVVRVRSGESPKMTSPLPGFELRRVSVSFRHVPRNLILDFAALPAERRDQVRQYIAELAQRSDHYRRQLSAER